MKKIPSLLLAPIFAGLLLQAATGGEAYYNIPVASLTLTEGTLPSGTGAPARGGWQMREFMQSYAVLDGAGEAYVSGNAAAPWQPVRPGGVGQNLCISAPEGREITGRLFVPNADMSGMVPVRFKIPASAASADAGTNFWAAKEQFYRSLWDRQIAGGAWFRHQLELIAKERGTNRSLPNNPRMNWNRGRQSDFQNTFELFSGGRAMSENLQLDRDLAMRGGTNGEVALTNLTGVTVRAMDWKPLLAEAKPQLDPLAAFIPADQHALFFPSFQALSDMTDEAEANGTPVLQMLEPRAEDAGVRDRYQKQLCLGLNELSRMLGPQIVASAAFTGGDSFLRVGADLAVLFEAKNLQLLQANIAARQAAAQAMTPGAQIVNGDIEGVKFSGVVTPDRAICSYLATVSNVVFVANSRTQLETLIRTALGRQPALRSQDEYVYFRQLYPRGDQNETAFLVLSDATIRRWCGPQWRIADSRRTRAAAVMADLQARHMEDVVKGKTGAAVAQTDYSAPDLGKLRLAADGVNSSIYGSLDFMTPISELPLATVTADEAAAYNRWRDGYQNNWSQFFDPIAVRFSVAKERLAADVTVMPLILGSRYNSFIGFTTGAKIAPDAGDPHPNALARLALAVNSQSEPVQQAGNFVGNMAPGLKANFLGWLGQSITLYADDDPFWADLAAATNTDRFMQQSFGRLPVALHCEVKNPLGVAAFLTAVHAFVDQSAPQMTAWANLEYQGRPYVKISPARLSTAENRGADWSVYYAVTPDSLTVTLSEDLLKRALDRQTARSATNAPVAANPKPWLGRSLGLQMQNKFMDMMLKLMSDSYQGNQQRLAWGNLPILNEWKRLYPDRDPVQLHEQVWGVKLLCPGGGSYVWNDAWHTMESTVYGHPGQPKTNPAGPFPGVTGVNLGLTFENNGLSAKGVVERGAKQ